MELNVKKVSLLRNLIIVVILVMSTSIATYAQDIIVTTKAEKITAKVTEVDVDIVKYKQYDYQDGPTYTIKKSDIASIIYQNGQVTVFDQPQQGNKPQPTSMGSNNEDKGQDYAYFKYLDRDDDAMSDFLKKYDNESYQIFRKGEALGGVGKGLFIPGIIFTAVGVGIMIVNTAIDEDEDLYIAGSAVTAVGQVFIITSIPLRAAGGGLKAKAKNLYEEKYFKGQSAITPSLQFNVNSYGVGLALKF